MNADTYYKTAIKEELSKRIENNSSYSLRAFAKALGIEASALSEILSNKRVPSYKMAQTIIRSLRLSPTDEEHFLASVAQTQRSRGLKKMSKKFRELKDPGTPARELSADLFRVISDWYHYAILEFTFVKGFRSSPQWIAKELGITVVEAKLAIERLKSLGLLTDENGKLSKTVGHFVTGDRHLTTPALKRRQKQILEKALYSLENDPIERRNMSAMTMAVDPKKIPQAKKMIDDFLNKLCSFLEEGEQKEVYEFGTFLVPLQKK